MRIGILEISLLQVIFYSTIYLIDSYIGFMLCLTIACIAGAILLLSLIFEMIEKSKVPRMYYYFILSAMVIPAVVLVLFTTLMTGANNWMNE